MRLKTDTLSRVAGGFMRFFKPEKRIIAVEVDDDIVKVVEALKADGSRKIVRIDEAALSRQDAQPLSEAMKRLFGASSSSARVIELNIPRHNLTVRYLRLPSTDDNELGKIIPIESLKHIPYNPEDIICGYRIIEKTPDGYSYVQLAIAEVQMIKDLARAAENAGLAVNSARAGFEALLEWYLRLCPGAQKETALVVSVDPNYIDIAVIEGDKLTFSRGVACRVSTDIAEMAEQVKVSVDAYRKNAPKAIEKVIVTGSVERAWRLKDALVPVLEMPVTFVDQVEDAGLGPEPRIALSNASFTGLLGIALNEDKMKIDLMPQEARAYYFAAAFKKKIFVTACLLLAVCLTAAGIAMKKLHDKAMMAAYLDSEMKKIGPDARKAMEMLDSMELVNASVLLRPRAVDVLSESVAAAPHGAFITMLSYEPGKTFTIRGTAPSLNEAFDYAKALAKSPYFGNVKTKYANKRSAGSQELVDFEITGNIAKAK